MPKTAGFLAAAFRTAAVIAVITLLGGLLVFAGVYFVRYDQILESKWEYGRYTDANYVDPEYPRLTPEQIVQLGWAHTRAQPKVGKPIHPKSSYVNFEPKKPAGVIRIGVFGCSFVEGSETAAGFDFPSILARQLAARGYSNVEVINFGAGNYGTHQAFLMWRSLGTRYGIDHAIVLPFWFHGHRDASFLYQEQSLGPAHARYIDNEGELSLATIEGESRLEAMLNYHRVLPGWHILRYDAKAPMWLRLLHPTPQANLRNPLYPGDDKYSEARQVYSKIFEAWAEEVDQLTVVFNDETDVFMAGAGQHYRSQAWSFFDKDPSFYVAPGNHYSALGNEGRALELLSFLVGEPGLEAERLVSSCATSSSSAGAAPKTLSGAQLWASGKPAAALRVMNPGDDYRQLNRRFTFADSQKSLVCIMTETGPRFVPFNGRLVDGAKLELQPAQGSAQAFAVVRSHNGVTGWLELAAGLSHDHGRNLLKLKADGLAAGAVAVRTAGTSGDSGEEPPMLEGVYDDHLKAVLLHPPGSHVLSLRADAGESEGLLGPKGTRSVFLKIAAQQFPLLTLTPKPLRAPFKTPNSRPLAKP